jgi:hypothetical protein
MPVFHNNNVITLSCYFHPINFIPTWLILFAFFLFISFYAYSFIFKPVTLHKRKAIIFSLLYHSRTGLTHKRHLVNRCWRNNPGSSLHPHKVLLLGMQTSGFLESYYAWNNLVWVIILLCHPQMAIKTVRSWSCPMSFDPALGRKQRTKKMLDIHSNSLDSSQTFPTN